MPQLLLLCFALAAVAFAVSPLDSERDSICSLKICNCPRTTSKITCVCDTMLQEIILQGTGNYALPKFLGSITISKCHSVIVASRSIKDILPLRSVNLSDIGTLKVEEEAFFWSTTKIQEAYPGPGLDITITNTTIPELVAESFKGQLNSVKLENVKINSIKSLAFANIARMDSIQFVNCHINNVETKAFNKLMLERFIFDGGFIGTLPSYTMNLIEVFDILLFQNLHIQRIYSRALVIKDVLKFSISSCIIDRLDGEGFHLSMKDRIVIDDNIIKDIHEGAFVGIHLGQRYLERQIQEELVFENNTLKNFVEYSLTFNTSGLKPIIDRIVLDQQCSCADIKTWTTKLVKYTSIKTPDTFAEKMWCKKVKHFNVISEFNAKHCVTKGNKVYWIVTVLIIVLISLLLVCSIGFWLYRRGTCKRYMNVPTGDTNRISVVSTNSHIIVLPENNKFYKYKETELHVMTESVEPIKEYVAPQTLTRPTT